MKLKALVMCRNPHSVRLLGVALEQFHIQQECCASAEEAIELVARGDFSFLMLDFDLPAAAKVAKLTRSAPSHRRPVIFGIIGATELKEVLQAGVNFPFYKPLQPEQLVHSIRAAYGFAAEDRRRAQRHVVETVVYLLFGKRRAIPTLMVNLSEEGFCIQAAERLPSFEKVDVHFLLPGTRRAIEGTAELVWTDNTGKAGMFLNEMTIATQRLLRKWLAQRSHKNPRQLSVESPAAALV
jgi:FixJ family two-component response regulator